MPTEKLIDHLPAPVILVSEPGPQPTPEQLLNGASAVEALWRELLESGELLTPGDDLPDMRLIRRRLSRDSQNWEVKPKIA